MQKLVIIGAGGFGREVAWLVERINRVKPTWELVGFVDDNDSLAGQTIGGYPVVGNNSWLTANGTDVFAVCAIGSSKIRKKVIEKLPDLRYATLIDPSVDLTGRIVIGEGSIICAGSILTVDITLGSHVIVNLDCTIGHDAILQSFVTLYPSVNISGYTILSEGVEMGTGSQIIQNINIGKGTIVGAGAVVIRELPGNCTAVGSPAKPIKFHESDD